MLDSMVRALTRARGPMPARAGMWDGGLVWCSPASEAHTHKPCNYIAGQPCTPECGVVVSTQLGKSEIKKMTVHLVWFLDTRRRVTDNPLKLDSLAIRMSRS